MFLLFYNMHDLPEYIFTTYYICNITFQNAETFIVGTYYKHVYCNAKIHFKQVSLISIMNYGKDFTKWSEIFVKPEQNVYQTQDFGLMV